MSIAGARSSKDTHAADVLPSRVDALLARRRADTLAFFSENAERIAELCHRMAERFARGGRLLAAGDAPAAASDARHVAVEFVHPVIVGKRALPALALTGGCGALDDRLDLLATPDDILIAFDAGGQGPGAADLRRAVAASRRRGCLTVSFGRTGADVELLVPHADPFIHQEIAELLYHVLWELVHVFFEHRGLLDGQPARQAADVGPSSFLYPFLSDAERDLNAVLSDVARSAVAKAQELDELRQSTLPDRGVELARAATALRASLDGGGTLLAFGNGGSATDAMDLVADFRAAPHGWPHRRALDLTADPAILTAIANDIGTEAIFSRQIIAYARSGDVAVALSTSGSSRNIIHALAEARARGLLTIAFVGYDGGRIAVERLADHVIVSPSQHIPRIQEAQACAYHVLRELVELAA